MRPLRLVIDGFGSYRELADITLSDVDYFVLTGPTGSGKSTVVDALCFALYGTVPRWGREKGVRNALAPSASECRVSLVFETSGRRYVVARRLARSSRDVVQTKEARLERLDDAVPIDAELDRLLEASIEQLAEGTHVTDAVTRLLGIGYEHFTQCVLLPQGRFAEFLNAKPSDRQDLLIELLAYAIYEDVGKRARMRATLAAERLALLGKQLTDIGEVTSEAIDAAERRVIALDNLGPQVDSAVETIDELRTKWMDANRNATERRAQLTALAELAMPAEVPKLAEQLASADERVRVANAELTTLESAEIQAEEHCAGLIEPAVLLRWQEACQRNAVLRKQHADAKREHEIVLSTEDSAATDLGSAEQALTAAESAMTTAERQHRAASLAAELKPGEPCPVCLRSVDELPHHDIPADLAESRANVKAAKASVSDARTRHTAATAAVTAASTRIAGLDSQLADLTTVLADAPPTNEVDAALTMRTAADNALDQARSAIRAGRDVLAKARRDRESLQSEEQRAWSALRATRDRFVTLSVPAVDGPDLAAAWETLLTWAANERTVLEAKVSELDATENALQDKGKACAAELTELFARHGIPVDDAVKAPAALAKHRESAERDLADLRSRRDRATALRADADKCQEESQVAGLLGHELRSDGFERWLCAEALDSLVLEASETLMQLSNGQYELDRGERNEFVVMDHNDAGARRPVNTLSGGETFQASLALALALSHQVMGLSGGRRTLNAMFLDEGFGTLDEVTLDTVASTLERLVEQTGSMIGIVTHVPSLAERVPVQFAVTRTGASSRIERVGV